MCYNFYKNFLYVIVQFYFGFYSVFCGQTLYEAIIYQLYNMNFTGAVLFWWGVMDIQHGKEVLMAEPNLYRPGIERKLFNTRVFWSWNVYAMYQAAIILFIGMVFTQDSPTSSGRTYTFWAGGHVVYFECVLIVNLVLLRYSHNLTGWGELLIFLQVTSFFWIMYLDTIVFPTGVIGYFSDEFYSSWTAWLGAVLMASLIFIEKKGLQAYELIKRMRQKRQ